jgi:hypothetical protein
MPSQALKASWRVRVGLWPGETEMLKDRARQWVYTAEDYAADVEATRGEIPGPHPEKPPTRFETKRKEATEYWVSLNEPRQLNWAELSFTWY